MMKNVLLMTLLLAGFTGCLNPAESPSESKTAESLSPVDVEMTVERAKLIARETQEVQALYTMGKGIFENCIEAKVETSCESEWVTCIENGWVVKYTLNGICHVKVHPQFGVTVLVDGDTGDVLSVYPEQEYFQNPKYCQDDTDCYCHLNNDYPPGVACTNFEYSPLVAVGIKPCQTCVCHKNQCVNKDRIQEE